MYNYDNLKRVTNITRDDYVTLSYDYDAQNRLKKESVHDDKNVSYHYEYLDGDAFTADKVSSIAITVDEKEIVRTLSAWVV